MRRFYFIGAAVLLFFNMSFSAKPYCGAELYSRDTIKYGRFDIRMRMISGGGIVSSFFLYYNNSYLGEGEPWREIDIEAFGAPKTRFQTNLITGELLSKKTSEQIYNTVSSISDLYHTYTLEWTPDSIVWYFDGKQIRKSIGQQVIDCQAKYMTYRFNTWITSDPGWAGVFNPASLPAYQLINWVKYSAYTPGAGPGGSNFTLSWTDDFDSFLVTRWMKGSWTFDGNSVDFIPNNIVVKNSTCLLCLTDATHPGFTGDVPVDNGTAINNIPAANFLITKPMCQSSHISVLNFASPSYATQNGKTPLVLYSINGRSTRDATLKASGITVKRTHETAK